MSTKNKLIYSCKKCGSQFPKWLGHCADCGAWNSLVEELNIIQNEIPSNNPRFANYTNTNIPSAVSLAEIQTNNEETRTLTGLSEFDRVLGGGLIKGAAILVGGDPGIGKSTLLLQTLSNLGTHHKTLYVTGEESIQQIANHAKRLNLPANKLLLLAETQTEKIISVFQREMPEVMVIDSIQTMYTEILQSSQGSISQVRESAAQIIRYTKQTGTTLFLVGHVTKEGTLAGPRILEHMVDCVLYFEGDQSNRYRMIRSIKNRFGAVNELGIFAMTEKGLREVSNPSAIFLSRCDTQMAGSSIMVTWEGSRPILVEVQALVDESYLENPRRVSVGLEQNRLAMLLAVLHRHGGIATYKHDIFANVVGGMRVIEPAADLALLFSIVSSLRNKPLPKDLVVFGEVGLAGEIRPVHNGHERLKEASKHGFKCAIIPQMNTTKNASISKDMKIIGVKNLADALNAVEI